MKQETAIAIREWLTSTSSVTDGQVRDNAAFDTAQAAERFDRGLALLGIVMNNLHYMASIRRKGPVNGMGTLVYELGKRVDSVQSQLAGGGVPKPRLTDGQEVRHDDKEFKECKDIKEGVLKQVQHDGGGTRNAEPETRNRFVLRNEFPFLGEKDCPDEFKVLVADMITSHRLYVDGHERLYYVADKSNEECYAAGERVVENYLNNRAIWEELEYYKKTGKILGTHPAFAKFRRREEIENMSAPELMKLYRNLPRNIAHAKKMIKDEKDSEGTKDRMERIKQSEAELKLVKRMMEVGIKKSEPQIKRIKGLR